MAIEQTSISYYGLNYVEHAEADFAEMKAHGVTCVILAPIDDATRADWLGRLSDATP